MYFTNAQRPLYNRSASANSEASDWHPATIKAHTAFSQCGFFVRSSLLFTGGLRRESSDSPFSLIDGMPTCTVCPPQLALEWAGFQNLIKETVMSNQQFQLCDAFKALANHTLTPEQAKSARVYIECLARSLMQAAAESTDFEINAEQVLDFYRLTYLFTSEEA